MLFWVVWAATVTANAASPALRIRHLSDHGNPAPISPPGSCYFKATGCIKASVMPNRWYRDTYGEANLGSKEDRSVCMQARRTQVALWCGVNMEAIEMAFNTPVQLIYNRKLSPPPPSPSPPSSLQAPTSPAGSCYFKTSSCSQESVRPNTWTRDSWGELNQRSGENRKVCEQERLSGYASWCGVPTSTITMHFNPASKPTSPPTSPPGSCWFMITTECKISQAVTDSIIMYEYNPNTWKRDNYVAEKKGAGKWTDTCVNTRRRDYAQFCQVDVSEVTMKFNPPADCNHPACGGGKGPPPPSPPPPLPSPPISLQAPESPLASCYFKVSSCKQPSVTINTWLRDVWGEKYKRSGHDVSACIYVRRNEFATWCNVDVGAITMHWNAPSGSCWYKISRCAQSIKLNSWQRDSWGEANKASGRTYDACMSRLNDYAQWCGVATSFITMFHSMLS